MLVFPVGLRAIADIALGVISGSFRLKKKPAGRPNHCNLPVVWEIDWKLRTWSCIYRYTNFPQCELYSWRTILVMVWLICSTISSLSSCSLLICHNFPTIPFTDYNNIHTHTHTHICHTILICVVHYSPMNSVFSWLRYHKNRRHTNVPNCATWILYIKLNTEKKHKVKVKTKLNHKVIIERGGKCVSSHAVGCYTQHFPKWPDEKGKRFSLQLTVKIRLPEISISNHNNTLN